MRDGIRAISGMRTGTGNLQARKSLFLTLFQCYLLLYIIASLMGAFTFIPGFYYGPSILDYLALFTLLLCVPLDGDLPRRLAAVVPYALLIALYYVMALLVSPFDSRDLLKQGLRNAMVLLTLAFAIPAALQDRKALRDFSIMVQLAAIAMLVICVAEMKSRRVAEFLAQAGPLAIDELDYHAFRTGGLLRNPNDLATFFCITFILSHWCPGFLKWAGRGSAVIGTYFSASRGGAYLLIICIIIYVYGSLRCGVPILPARYGRSMLTAAVLLFLLFAGYKAVGPKMISVKGESGLSRGGRIMSLSAEGGVSGRLALLDHWLKVALDAPLYGKGLYSFQGGPYSPDAKRVRNLGSHNMWLMLFGEVGLLGPLGFLIIVVLGLMRINRIPKRNMDRMVLTLLWIAFLFLSFKSHNQLEHRYQVIAMAMVQYLPLLIRRELPDPLGARRRPGTSTPIRSIPAGLLTGRP